MAVDKLVDSTQLDADLTSVANAIRTKGGTSASLAFPADFVSAIAAITGGTIYEDSGTLTLTSDYSYTTGASASYTGSILISTSLSKILLCEIWEESWEAQTATRPCFACAVFADPSLGIPRSYSVTTSPYYYGAGSGFMASTTDWYARSVNAGPILHCMTDSVPEGKFGIKTHNATDYKLKTGDVIRWHAIGTKA